MLPEALKRDSPFVHLRYGEGFRADCFASRVRHGNRPAGCSHGHTRRNEVPVQDLKRRADAVEGNCASADEMVAANHYFCVNSATGGAERCDRRFGRWQPGVQHLDGARRLLTATDYAASGGRAVEFAVRSLDHWDLGRVSNLTCKSALVQLWTKPASAN